MGGVRGWVQILSKVTRDSKHVQTTLVPGPPLVIDVESKTVGWTESEMGDGGIDQLLGGTPRTISSPVVKYGRQITSEPQNGCSELDTRSSTTYISIGFPVSYDVKIPWLVNREKRTGWVYAINPYKPPRSLIMLTLFYRRKVECRDVLHTVPTSWNISTS